MKRVFIIPDPFNKETWSDESVEDVCEYLKQQFAVFPKNTRIYHNQIAVKNDVTPTDERSIKHLQSLEGDFYVVIYPSELLTIIYWAVLIVTAAFSVYTYMTMPKPQVSAPQSSNNDLASRQNQARLGGRIPEIFGQLRAVPDLIAAPMTYYDANNKEIEECLMLCTRGYVQVHDVKDDQTNINDISDMAVSVYDPHTSIIGTPIYQVGAPFTEAPSFSIKSKSINGQTLNVPNDQKVESTELYFQFPGLIKTTSSSINLDELFDPNDSIGIYGAEFFNKDIYIAADTTFTANKELIVISSTDIASVNNFKEINLSGALIKVTTEIEPAPPETEPTYIDTLYDLSGRYKVSNIIKNPFSGRFAYTITLEDALSVNPKWEYINTSYTDVVGIVFTGNTSSINLNGTYIVESVTSNEIKLINPDLLNSDWAKVNFLPNQNTQGHALVIRLDKLNNSWVGWYSLDLENTEELVFNLFYQNGLFYQDSKGGVWAESMTVQVEYQYINSSNQPAGQIYSQQFTITNSSKSPFGTTRRIHLNTPGRVRFRIARTTPTKNDKTQDLTKIKDVYAASKSKVLNYGDVTIVRSKTLGTEGALSLKERKLNMLVTRKLPVNGIGALMPTKSAAQALIYLALDSKNGRRSTYEIDINQILAVEQEVNSYFGSTKASEFSYTLDDNNLSFEEIAGMIASASFCETYRLGSKLRLKFEKPQPNAVLLFNHRNKVPKSEKRSYSNRIDKGYDGIELEYTSSVDDARIKYSIPENGSAKNPMSIKTTGIRTDEQAKTRAWREWNKLLFKRITCQFDALDESNLLARNDKIMVADNTLLGTEDGEVEAVEGLTLTLSQNVEFSVNQVKKIYLQMPNGSVDMIDCRAGLMTNQVVLVRPPVDSLVVGTDRYLKTTYQIVKSEDAVKSAFLVAEMSPSGKMTNSVKAVNYDARYYQQDHDFF
ncbi:host specificity factor TipJ family phage tail protein [Acinetobacter sp.]|uniref:host specificity factor TipJ family phage tail protein n=3 Tax=unclassified Acinetobacter TaxID=196816 RepID=UPI0028AC8ECE|nr:host specificity factor TipJ family phage tail protein [Acinetobacter sp.]